MSELYQLGQGHDYTDDQEIARRGEEFVSYGQKNDYPNFLIDLYQKFTSTIFLKIIYFILLF